MRGLIYDAVIRPLTSTWYREVLSRLSLGSRLLDVGIGTGGALVANAPIIWQKDLHVVGVDIDPDYVERANKLVREKSLDRNVEVRLQSVYDHVAQAPYDAVYFSASFMLLPDPIACLKHIRAQLAPGGRVFFTQTFQEKRSVLLEKAKPMLHKVTTIHFGQVTYEADFMAIVRSAGMHVDALETLGKAGPRTYRLVVARFDQEASA